MLTNDVLIRGTLESHRAGFKNEKKIVKAATTPATTAGNPATPRTPSAPGGVGGQATPPTTAPLRDNIFSGVKIASAYLYISDGPPQMTELAIRSASQ